MNVHQSQPELSNNPNISMQEVPPVSRADQEIILQGMLRVISKQWQATGLMGRLNSQVPTTQVVPYAANYDIRRFGKRDKQTHLFVHDICARMSRPDGRPVIRNYDKQIALVPVARQYQIEQKLVVVAFDGFTDDDAVLISRQAQWVDDSRENGTLPDLQRDLSLPVYFDLSRDRQL